MSLKRTEILRSRNLFKRIALEGRRIDGTLVRCAFLTHDKGGKHLQVGFKVSSRRLNAVRRNRIRRLMRESLAAEREVVDEVLRKKDLYVGMIIFYKGAKELSVGRLKLASIQKDIGLICRTITSAL